MSEDHQVNKAHNRKKDKFKKKSSKKVKFNSENLDEPSEEQNKNLKNLADNDKDEFDKAKAKNPRAFAINSFVAAERQFRR